MKSIQPNLPLSARQEASIPLIRSQQVETHSGKLKVKPNTHDVVLVQEGAITSLRDRIATYVGVPIRIVMLDKLTQQSYAQSGVPRRQNGRVYLGARSIEEVMEPGRDMTLDVVIETKAPILVLDETSEPASRQSAGTAWRVLEVRDDRGEKHSASVALGFFDQRPLSLTIDGEKDSATFEAHWCPYLGGFGVLRTAGLPESWNGKAVVPLPNPFVGIDGGDPPV
jgi:hypothetical protein